MKITNKVRYLGLSLILALLYSPSAFSMEEDNLERITASNHKSITQGKYTAGGIVSTSIGFGLGHAIQGRYMQKGWIFTAGELVSLGAFLGYTYSGISNVSISLEDFSNIFEGSEDGDSKNKLKSEKDKLIKKLKISAVFLGIYLGFRIWEKIDIWMLPSDYKVVQEPALQLKPLVSLAKDSSLNLGLSLKYQF